MKSGSASPAVPLRLRLSLKEKSCFSCGSCQLFYCKSKKAQASASAKVKLPAGTDLKYGIWDGKQGLPSRTNPQGTALQVLMEKAQVLHRTEGDYQEGQSDETHTPRMAVSGDGGSLLVTVKYSGNMYRY